jgi:hypothetical protein
MSGFFSFIHFHWIRDVEKPLKPIFFLKIHTRPSKRVFKRMVQKYKQNVPKSLKTSIKGVLK